MNRIINLLVEGRLTASKLLSKLMEEGQEMSEDMVPRSRLKAVEMEVEVAEEALARVQNSARKEIDRLNEEQADIRRRLEGYPDSKLHGDGGLAEAVMNDHRRLHREVEEMREAKDQHMELLYAVSKKYPGETRHQTALRYIQQAERQCTGGAQQSQEEDKI